MAYARRYAVENREAVLAKKRECERRRIDRDRPAHNRRVIERYHRTKVLKGRRLRTAEEKIATARAAGKRRYKRDPLGTTTRGLLKRTLDLTGRLKLSRTEIMLGYTRHQLRQRIEFQFYDGMSWDNYGEWHIDHKKPIKRFVDQGHTNPALINALCNLQPMWASDNHKKWCHFECKSA